MSILIVQALCPARHCIVAVSGEGEPDQLALLLRKALELAIEKPLINPWCALCGAPQTTWTYEPGQTKFSSMEEARPELAKLEAEQLATRQAMIDSGRAYDAHRAN